MTRANTDKIVEPDGVHKLKTTLTPYGAERILKVLPQLKALNNAGKTQADAALAMDMTVTTLRRYVATLGWTWKNLKARGPYVGKKGGAS